MTPTTEAVIPVSAAHSVVLWRSPSTWGAPRKMNMKQGTKVKNIRLVDEDHDIDCKIDGLGAMKLKSEYVKKAL